ncbi:ribosome biogenesis protein Nop16 [Tribonema minus]|uniref:Nucleolar protein 16 n=1 Tax=Tribonema minus TaxID=303371 RepID=A0A836C9H5_9STRA|nr:ribosome biogenesis protein Nop16 [Tribonema minus]
MRPRKQKARRCIPPKAAKQKLNRKHLQPIFHNEVIAKSWDPKASARVNLAQLGLATSANHVIQAGLQPSHEAAVLGGRPDVTREQVVQALGVTIDSHDLQELTRNPRLKPMSEHYQRYMAKLIEKHGDDYVAMRRDIETNWRQYAEEKCERLCIKFKCLSDEHRLVPVPEFKGRRRAAPL